MTGELCPYCGTLLTTSLKFCVNCRRSVTEDKIRKSGSINTRTMSAGAEEDEEDKGAARYKLSRGSSYDSIRQFRTFFISISTLLTIFFVYYFTMKFVIHQPIPFEEELTQFVQSISGKLLQGQASPGPAQEMPAQGTAGQGYQQDNYGYGQNSPQ